MWLVIMWIWFAAQLTPMPCLTPPTLLTVPDLGRWAGTYSWQDETVRVEEGRPAWVAVHEFAHHYWWVCHVEDRPLGRHFLRETGHPDWDREAGEQFADTFAWVLVGQAGPNVVKSAAHVFLGRVDTPTPAQWKRLT